MKKLGVICLAVLAATTILVGCAKEETYDDGLAGVQKKSEGQVPEGGGQDSQADPQSGLPMPPGKSGAGGG